MLRKTTILFGFAAALSMVASTLAKGVQILTPDTFDSTIGSKPALVQFYASWCPHSKHLAPIYDKLAQDFADNKDKVLIAKIDADKYPSVARKYGLDGYPTIKWFANGIDGTPQEYYDKNNLKSLKSFVEKQTGINLGSSEKSSKEKTPVIEVLNDENFDEKVHKSGKAHLVEFYAPWCDFCKDLAPTYAKVARDFFHDDNVVIAKIDATKETITANKYEVDSYPTIIFFGTDGSIQEYEGEHTEFDILSYVNERAGTERVSGGRLSHKAGRNEQLDEIAMKFSKAKSPEEKSALRKEGIKLANSLKDSDKNALRYVQYFNKAVESPDYLKDELLRLRKLISSNTKNNQEIDELSIHQNILSAFFENANTSVSPKEEL